MCKIDVQVNNMNDLYFVITNTILNYTNNTFTVEDIYKELERKSVPEYYMTNIENTICSCIERLITIDRIDEEPRSYRKRKETN